MTTKKKAARKASASKSEKPPEIILNIPPTHVRPLPPSGKTERPVQRLNVTMVKEERPVQRLNVTMVKEERPVQRLNVTMVPSSGNTSPWAQRNTHADETVQVTVRLRRSTRDKLAHLAIDERTSIQGLLDDAIRRLLKAHGIPE